MSEAQTYATGKRKTAVARVWIKPGSGAVQVNGSSIDVYFERETSRMVVRQGLELLELHDKYDVVATVVGGGHSAQAAAMRHGIARALTSENPERRGVLKKAGSIELISPKKLRWQNQIFERE